MATTRRSVNDSHFVFLDLFQTSSLNRLSGVNFSAVILCASICSVDECEKNKKYTNQINVLNTFKLVSVLKNTAPDLRVVMLSTDMVLDGAKEKPTQFEKTEPLTEYGRQKAELEQKLMNRYENIKVLRFGKVIEKSSILFNGWVDKLKIGEKITVFNDLVFAPISIDYAIQSILHEINIRNSSNEIVHVSSGCDISYYEAALWLSKNLNLSSQLVEGVSVHDKFPLKIIPKRIALGNNLEIPTALKGIEALKVFLE